MDVRTSSQPSHKLVLKETFTPKLSALLLSVHTTWKYIFIFMRATSLWVVSPWVKPSSASESDRQKDTFWSGRRAFSHSVVSVSQMPCVRHLSLSVMTADRDSSVRLCSVGFNCCCTTKYTVCVFVHTPKSLDREQWFMRLTVLLVPMIQNIWCEGASICAEAWICSSLNYTTT